MIKHSKNSIIKDFASLIGRLKYFDFGDLINLSQLELIYSYMHSSYPKVSGSDLCFTFSPSASGADICIRKIAVYMDIEYTYTAVENQDIFSDYLLEIYLHGYSTNLTKESHFFCWHLDRESYTNGKFAHPLYHFQAGGHKLEGYKHGDLLFIGSPRIPHPPMDIVLAIHFILRNFINTSEYSTQMAIINDYDYREIVKRAQERVLDPYFHTFHKSSSHKTYTPQNLFPLYL